MNCGGPVSFNDQKEEGSSVDTRSSGLKGRQEEHLAVRKEKMEEEEMNYKVAEKGEVGKG